MAGNRDGTFPPGPGQQAYNDMMSGNPQFMQPNMACYPMLQQPVGMNPAMANQMFPMQQFHMATRRMPPPTYNQHIAQNFPRTNNRSTVVSRPTRPPPSQKDIQFQLQQQRLKQFGQTKHVKADADKFIESMFGKTEKSKTKDGKPNTMTTDSSFPVFETATTQDEDGFGDFLQGPMTVPKPARSLPESVVTTPTNINTLQSSTQITEQTSPVMSKPSPVLPKPVEEKKDLMSMMMACSDLKAPQKAKLFEKPLVKDIQVQPHKNITYQQSQTARQWQSAAELEGLFHQNKTEEKIVPVPTAQHVSNDPTIGLSPTPTQHPGPSTSPQSTSVLPEWCYLSSTELPPLYQQVYEASLVDGKIDTNRLYPVLILSTLPREVLGYIWSLANASTPGQLIQPELNAILALIALAQNNHSIMHIEILKRCPKPPIPFFGHPTAVPPSGPPVSDNTNQNNNNITPPRGNQAPVPNSGGSFQVVAPIPVHNISGIAPPKPVPTSSIPSEPAIITHTSEDDFADFQAADKTNAEDEFGDFMGTSNPACISVEEKPPHVVSVHKSEPKVIDQMTADEKYSNVRSFFGSSGSSASLKPALFQGHTTPNSLEEEEYTDGRESTSQFSTSEQSESEDIRAFESYVEEFNRKKEKLQPESPLHNPFPRLPVVDKTTSNIVIPTIPSAIGLQLSSEATSDNDFTDFKAAPNLPKSVSTKDSDFADFQSGLSSDPNAWKSDLNLIGDEDKYGALRSLVIEEPSVDTKPSEATVPFAQFEETSEQSESDWADFASAAPVTTNPENKLPDKSAILSLYSETPAESNWADFGDTVTPTAETVNSQPSWISANSSQATNSNLFINDQNTTNMSNSVSSTSLTGTETEDDWSDFSTAVSHDQQAGPVNPIQDDDWFNNSSASHVVTVKKTLKPNEVLNVFKVRDDPEKLASYKLSNFETKVNKVRQVSLDDDGPPPLDDHDDDEDHDFARGYDLEEYNNPSPIGGYGYNNQNKGVFLNQVAKKISEKSERNSLSPETEDDSSSSKDSYPWKDKSKQFREDSQSVCSLELPAKGASIKTGSDNGGSDSHSVSSMEFGQFESSSKTPVSAESKSLDSLDFPENGGEVDTEEQTDQPGMLNNSMNQSNGGVFKALADRYNITDEIVTSDRYSYEWDRCLDNCWRMIRDSNSIFNSISSSSVCNEVLKSSQGSAYITGIVEIYRVACRVITAMNAHNLSTSQLEKLMRDIDLAWTNLTAFLVGAGTLPESKSFEFSHGVMKSDSQEAQFNSCGVCLLNVDVKLKVISGEEDVSKLTYGRRQYHAPCANFWVNCVDSTLPGLCLPELL